MYCLASSALRFLSSSLYFVAVLDSYLTFGSLEASAAEPPWDWKYLIADSFPPTFIVLSCSHCHSTGPRQYVAPFGLEAVEGVVSNTYDPVPWNGQTRYARPNYDGARSSRGKGKFRRVQTPMLDFCHRSRNRSG